MEILENRKPKRDQNKRFSVGLFLLACCLFDLQASAEMRSKKALKIEEGKLQISASLSEGYHFNLKAPNQIVTKGQILLPSSANPTLVQFPWPAHGSINGSIKNGNAKGNQLQLYVCDNANTYCETHEIDLGKSERLRGAKPEKQTSTSQSQNGNGISKNGETNKATQLQTILARAKKNQSLVLLDFSARWCPACVRIENEILPTAEFKNAAKGFEVVKVDVDLFDNFPLSKKYRVKGIPTLLVLDSEGREIDRILDFQTLPVLTKFLASANQNKQPLDELAEELSKKPTAGKTMDSTQTTLSMARRLLASDRPKEALKILEALTPAPVELAQAKIASAQQDFSKDPLLKTKYIETLNRELASEPASLRSLSWRTELIGLLGPHSPVSKKLLAEGKTLAETWLTDEAKLSSVLKGETLGEYTGYERLLVATSLGDLLEASGATEEDTWKRAIEVGEGYHISALQPGPARRFLLLLIQAKEYSKAETLSLSLLKVEPKNFDVRRRRIKILAAQNKHEEASLLAKDLLKEAEGRNQFWVAESLAMSYVALKKNKEALSLLDQYLSRKELNLEAMAKTKKSLESLRSKIVIYPLSLRPAGLRIEPTYDKNSASNYSLDSPALANCSSRVFVHIKSLWTFGALFSEGIC